MGAQRAVHTNIHSLHEARQALQQMKIAMDAMVMETNVFNQNNNISVKAAGTNAIASPDAQAVLMHQIFGA